MLQTHELHRHNIEKIEIQNHISYHALSAGAGVFLYLGRSFFFIKCWNGKQCAANDYHLFMLWSH